MDEQLVANEVMYREGGYVTPDMVREVLDYGYDNRLFDYQIDAIKMYARENGVY